jgi:DNA mismatch repair protein MutL
VELLPEQMVTFAAIADELERNGFEAEPFGPRTLAVKATPVGLEGKELERVLEELLGETEKTAQVDNEELRRTRIAASIACHAAIKVNMPLEPAKIDWLLAELGKTEHPMSCPHGRPIALRYSLEETYSGLFSAFSYVFARSLHPMNSLHHDPGRCRAFTHRKRGKFEFDT